MAGEMLRMGVEELAMAFAQLGHAEEARALLVSASEQPITPQEANARLRAAGHSLLAREWLSISEDGQTAIVEPLAPLARAAARPDFSLRCDFTTDHAVFRLVFHHAAGRLVRHVVSGGVVHSLGVVELAELLDEVAAFFRVAEAAPFDGPPAVFPLALLEDLNSLPDQAAVARRLEQAGAAPLVAARFAADLRSSQFRGSVLRVEYPAGREPESERGLLLVRGGAQLWLIRTEPTPAEPTATLLPADEPTFRELVATLLRPPGF